MYLVYIKLTYSMHLFNANAFYSEVIMMVVKFFVLLGVERFVKKKKKANPRCTLVLFFKYWNENISNVVLIILRLKITH